MVITMLSLATVLSVGALEASDRSAPELEVWAVDPLEKVFRDAAPLAGAEAMAEVARGEHAVFQVVVRSGLDLSGVGAKLSQFALRADRKQALPRGTVRFVSYVPVDRPIQTPPKDQLRVPPADYPDPLLEVKTIDVAAGEAQPIWITVPIPLDADPGLYRSKVTVTANAGGQEVSASVALTIRVYRARVERSRLWVTNWFSMQWPHMKISPQPESPEYYDLLRRYARSMAAHRQNVAIISPIGLADFRVGADGELDIDFSRFDKWVTIFTEEGVIGRIEGGHLGGRVGDWESQFVVQIRRVKDGAVEVASVDPASPEADRFYARFLPTLVGHLREKGWLDIYMQHLADEPITQNIGTYRAMANLVRKHAPELRTVEACHTKDLVGAIDIWVPQLNYYHESYDHYRSRQGAGEEVWFYTCVFPQGEYANRFIEQPLIKTRLLHWINFRYGATGYLHWGYNFWSAEDPFRHTTRAHGGTFYLPAGDAWIVYPGEDGPLDSIRFEAMRDGIADYELLAQLAERDPDGAMRLASKHIPDFDRYDTDIRVFRETRRELLELASKL